MTETLKPTPLRAEHVARGARMVPFAGYELPIQFPEGVLGEHRWTRSSAGVFDVSHMGPAFLRLERPTGDPQADHETLAAILEPLLSADLRSLKPGHMRYAALLGVDGGMLDDLMTARLPDAAAGRGLYLVVNGAVKAADFALISEAAAGVARLERADDGVLIALQGPLAAEVLEAFAPGASDLGFMRIGLLEGFGSTLLASRSGYTGEDGFELLLGAQAGVAAWRALLEDPRVHPVGLGARDSLRLEAGLLLYGQDADPGVSPVEAGVAFAVSRRRLGAGEVRGGPRLGRELGGELARVRVGLLVTGAPARPGAEIRRPGGEVVGRVTSGGFSPSLGRPIAMGYVPPDLASPGAALAVQVRDRVQPAEVAALPFVPHRYVRKA